MARIKTTRTVRFALWALRIYLLVLLLLIGIKFARVFSTSQTPDHAAASLAAAGTAVTNQPSVETKP